MKTKISLYLIASLAFLIIAGVSCTKEDPLEPIAEFTTDLENNTTYAGESFYMYLEKSQGDFLTFFSGLNEGKTYNPDDPTVIGANIDPALDSFEVTVYKALGTYSMTLVASSSGNWAEDYEEDVFSIDINVLDRRTGFVSYQIDKTEGMYSEDGTEIYFYTHDMDDISAKKPNFITASIDAVVTVDDVVQTAEVTVVDFSSDGTPGEGRPVVYRVLSPNGEYEEFTVKYILSPASSEKQLFSLTSVSWSNTLYELSAEDETNKQVKIIYDSLETITGVKMIANATFGAKVYLDGEEISEDDEKVNLATSTVVTVEAQDLSTQDYDILMYRIESLSTFNLVASDGSDLNPLVTGTIEGNTISLSVLAGTDLTTLVAEFEGISNSIVSLGSVELTSGVTAADYSGSPVVEVKATDGTIINSFTINITEL